jgi:hypothetical protein
MRKAFASVFLILFTQTAFAQVPQQDSLLNLIDKPLPPKDTVKVWDLGGMLNLNFTQTYFQNWLPGGESAISNTNLFTGFAHYRKNNSKWINTLRLAYGYIILLEDNSYTKTDDQIEFLSTYSKKAFGRHWYWASLLTARTQFTQGFESADEDVKTSDFASPLFAFAGVGPEYSPDETLSIILAPLATKLTVVTDQPLANAGAYGVEPAVVADDGTIIEEGRNTRWEFGAYMYVYWNRENIIGEIDLLTNLWAFRNYFGESDNIDVNFQLILQYALKDWLQTSFNLLLFYDEEFGPIEETDEGLVVQEGELQLKEVFVLSFTFDF